MSPDFSHAEKRRLGVSQGTPPRAPAAMEVTSHGSASFSNPSGICVDGETIIVAEQGSHRISKLGPGGEVSAFVGSGNHTFADGQGASASFYSPAGLAMDQQGNLIVADNSNHRIRKVAPDGMVTTIAGGGTAGFLDAVGTSAQFNSPIDVAVNEDGNVFVADHNNHRIRKITPDGTVTTLAGSGNASFADGRGRDAHFHNPTGVACHGGCVYVAEFNNHRIRKIAADGVVTTQRSESHSWHLA